MKINFSTIKKHGELLKFLIQDFDYSKKDPNFMIKKTLRRLQIGSLYFVNYWTILFLLLDRCSPRHEDRS